MMGARIIPFPARHQDNQNGTVVVMGDRIDGFEVAHQSASENSWGSFSGPYRSGQEAIASAYALNRDSYGGGCDVSICDAAVEDWSPGVGLVTLPGDF